MSTEPNNTPQPNDPQSTNPSPASPDTSVPEPPTPVEPTPEPPAPEEPTPVSPDTEEHTPESPAPAEPAPESPNPVEPTPAEAPDIEEPAPDPPATVEACSVQFGTANFSVYRNEKAALITVTLKGNCQTQVTVKYATTDDTAVAGTDYTSTSNSLLFNVGESSKSFTVPLVKGRNVDASMALQLELSDPTGATLGEPHKAALTILPATTFRGYLKETVTPRVATHLSLIIGLMLLTLLGSWVIRNNAESRAYNWIHNLSPGQKTTKANELAYYEPAELSLLISDVIQVNDAQKKRLQEQLNEVRRRSRHHLDVMVSFYTYYYVGILLPSITAGIAAICLVLISKRGWDDVNEYVITVFLIMTAITLFYRAFPDTFRQEDNINRNRALYLAYVNLENELSSYCVTGITTGDVVEFDPESTSTSNQQPAGETDQQNNQPQAEGSTTSQTNTDGSNGRKPYGVKSVTPEDFIHYLDYRLAKLNDIAVGFDATKVVVFSQESFNTQ